MRIDNLADVVEPALKEALSNYRNMLIFREGKFWLHEERFQETAPPYHMPIATGRSLYELVQNYKKNDSADVTLKNRTQLD